MYMNMYMYNVYTAVSVDKRLSRWAWNIHVQMYTVEPLLPGHSELRIL